MDPRTDKVNDERDMLHVPVSGNGGLGGRDPLSRDYVPGEVAYPPLAGIADADDRVTMPAAAHDADDTNDPDAIRQSIDHTRHDMGRTIDAIQERLSPQHLMDQATETVKEATIGKVQDMATNIRYSAADAGNSVMDVVRQNPIPAAMAGLGLGWLLYRAMSTGPQRPRYYPEQPYGYQRTNGTRYQYPPNRVAYADPGNGYTSDQPGLSDRVSDAAQQARDKAGDLAGQVQDRVGQFGDQVQDRAGDLSDRVQTGASQTRDWFGDMLQENPLVMGIAAMAVGAAVGFAVKETPQENRLMGQTHDNLMQKAQDTAQDTAQKVQQVAQKAAATAQDEAQRQGLINQN